MSYRGLSYALRVREVNEIYNREVRKGLSNREIWRRFVYPKFGICEKTFYNYLSAEFRVAESVTLPSLFDQIFQ